MWVMGTQGEIQHVAALYFIRLRAYLVALLGVTEEREEQLSMGVGDVIHTQTAGFESRVARTGSDDIDGDEGSFVSKQPLIYTTNTATWACI